MRGLSSLLLLKWGRVGEKGAEGMEKQEEERRGVATSSVWVGESVAFGLGVMFVVCV
jgi:ApbE superfamily uncharacterized protein (UPF0280 family)